MRGLKKASLACAVGAVTCLVGVAGAEASAIQTFSSVYGGSAYVRGGPGEVNRIEVVNQGSMEGPLVIRDLGALLIPDYEYFTACTWRIIDVYCGYDVASVTVHLGDRADTVRVRRVPQTQPTTVYGEGGADVFQGGPGNESFHGGPGPDVFRGGDHDPNAFYENDSVSYSGSTTGVSVTKDGLANDGVPGEGDMVGSDIEGISGTPFNDVLEGWNGRDLIAGFAGDDVLRGLGGDDELSDHEGTDLMQGGAGNDILWAYWADEAVDDLSCGDGIDQAWVFAPDVRPADCESGSP